MKEEHIEQDVVNRRIALQAASRVYAESTAMTPAELSIQVVKSSKEFERFIAG